MQLHLFRIALVFGFLASAAFSTGTASAEPICTFSTAGATMTLDADCTTDATIVIPDGFFLDGAGHTITAVDPSGAHFLGAVVKNGGVIANVQNVIITTSGLANACDAGDDRLRGILFEGASGSILNNTVTNINQGASGCQEGNAIEVRNAPFDGTHPDTQSVEIAYNTVDAYQKTGIVANGDVTVNIHHNPIGASATQANLAANSVQLGFGAKGSVTHNHIDGNQWLGASNFAATAVLLSDVDGVNVSLNNFGGNADVGIYVFADGVTLDNNRVFESGPDGLHGDYGIVNFGSDNAITNNKVRGYETAYYLVTDGNNKTIPSP